MLLNFKKGGISWMEHDVTAEQVKARNIGITDEGSEVIGQLAAEIIETAKKEGMLL